MRILVYLFGLLAFTWLFPLFDWPTPKEQVYSLRSPMHSGLYKVYLAICLLLSLLLQVVFILIWIAAFAILITKLWR